MNTIEKTLKNQIMATDIYISLASAEIELSEMEKDVERIIDQMREFEQRYSRFIPNNYVANLNESEEFTATDDLIELLKAGESYYKNTNGLFDPSIHNALINEGYNTSKKLGFYNKSLAALLPKRHYSFSDLNIDYVTKVVKKPKELKIDFGGIGKGYVVDKITEWVSRKYENFCIDAGGDMFLGGVDIQNKYPYWAIEIENPLPNQELSEKIPTLLIKNMAVATSGVGKRLWVKEGVEKNHIINPKTGKSVNNDICSVTVIGPNTIYADIYAKTLLLLGHKDGLEYCYNGNISAVFITKFGDVIISDSMKEYIWHE